MTNNDTLSFPSPSGRSGGAARGKLRRVILTTEQTEWLRRVYPDTPSREIASAMGVSARKLLYMAKELGLHKSKDTNRYAAWWTPEHREQHAASIRKAYKMERRRMELCIPRRTRLVIPDRNYTNQQVHCRQRMVDRYGYLVGDSRATDTIRFTIYYDNETNRNPRAESFARKIGFVIKQY